MPLQIHGEPAVNNCEHILQTRYGTFYTKVEDCRVVEHHEVTSERNKMRGEIKRIVVVDVEATCWETNEEQGDRPNELIEIGVCTLDARTGLIENRASIAVRPRSTEISPFCTTLTGWTQEQIDAEGLDIVDAFAEFSKLYDPKGGVWASYGEYDRWKLSSTHKSGVGALYGIEAHNNPFEQFRTHINVKTYMGLRFNRGKEVGMKRALEQLNLQLEGRHHNGADDALNIAKILSRTIQP